MTTTFLKGALRIDGKIQTLEILDPLSNNVFHSSQTQIKFFKSIWLSVAAFNLDEYKIMSSGTKLI